MEAKDAGDGRLNAGSGGKVGLDQLQSLALRGQAAAFEASHHRDQRPPLVAELLHQLPPKAAASATHHDDAGCELIDRGHDRGKGAGILPQGRVKRHGPASEHALQQDITTPRKINSQPKRVDAAPSPPP
jgi:hypothetical protein